MKKAREHVQKSDSHSPRQLLADLEDEQTGREGVRRENKEETKQEESKGTSKDEEEAQRPACEGHHTRHERLRDTWRPTRYA